MNPRPESSPRKVSRRAVAKGGAWAVPAIVVAAPAPAFAASCGTPLSLLYGDFGTVTQPIVSFTGTVNTTCQTINGVVWSVATFTMTIRNTSTTKTISNLQVPYPYNTLSNSGTGCTTPSTEISPGVWSNPTLAGFAGGPSTGRDTQFVQGATGTLTFPTFATFAAIIPATISGTGANGGSTLCSADTVASTQVVPTYVPPVTTLAPGASTTFNIVLRVESSGTCTGTYNQYSPDFIVGSVC